MEFLQRMRQFFHDVAAEFRRVTWPSRQQVTESTVIVLVVVFILGVFLWGVDVALSWPVEKLLKLSGRG